MTADQREAALRQEAALRRNAITRCAAMQWSLIFLDTLLADRPTDRAACIRDLANAE